MSCYPPYFPCRPAVDLFQDNHSTVFDRRSNVKNTKIIQCFFRIILYCSQFTVVLEYFNMMLVKNSGVVYTAMTPAAVSIDNHKRKVL